MESFENLDEVFVLICCVWCIMARHLHFWSRLSRAHCSRSLVVFTDPTLQHYKKSCYHELSPASPRKQAILDLFLIALSCTSTFNELTEACKVWAIDLGLFFFPVFLSIRWSDLEVDLQGHPLLERLLHCVHPNLNALDQQTAKSAHTCWWSFNQGNLITSTFHISMEAARLYIIFHRITERLLKTFFHMTVGQLWLRVLKPTKH